MNLDRDHSRLLNYINLVKETHSIQSKQSENFIIYVKFFGQIISFALSSILYVILRFQLEYSQSLLSPTSDIKTN